MGSIVFERVLNNKATIGADKLSVSILTSDSSPEDGGAYLTAKLVPKNIPIYFESQVSKLIPYRSTDQPGMSIDIYCYDKHGSAVYEATFNDNSNSSSQIVCLTERYIDNWSVIFPQHFTSLSQPLKLNAIQGYEIDIPNNQIRVYQDGVLIATVALNKRYNYLPSEDPRIVSYTIKALSFYLDGGNFSANFGGSPLTYSYPNSIAYESAPIYIDTSLKNVKQY